MKKLENLVEKVKDTTKNMGKFFLKAAVPTALFIMAASAKAEAVNIGNILSSIEEGALKINVAGAIDYGNSFEVGGNFSGAFGEKGILNFALEAGIGVNPTELGSNPYIVFKLDPNFYLSKHLAEGLYGEIGAGPSFMGGYMNEREGSKTAIKLGGNVFIGIKTYINDNTFIRFKYRQKFLIGEPNSGEGGMEIGKTFK